MGIHLYCVFLEGLTWNVNLFVHNSIFMIKKIMKWIWVLDYEWIANKFSNRYNHTTAILCHVFMWTNDLSIDYHKMKIIRIFEKCEACLMLCSAQSLVSIYLCKKEDLYHAIGI